MGMGGAYRSKTAFYRNTVTKQKTTKVWGLGGRPWTCGLIQPEKITNYCNMYGPWGGPRQWGFHTQPYFVPCSPLQSLTAFCCFFEEFYWGIRRPFFLTLKNSWGIPGGVLDPRIHAYFSKACTPERTMSLTSKVKCIRMRGDRGDRCLKIQPSKLAPDHKLSDFPTALLSHGLVTAHQAVGPRNIG